MAAGNAGIRLPLIAIHEPPFGPAGLALFVVAGLLLVRQQASAPARSAPPHPASTS